MKTTDEFTFGKHQGETLEDVCEDDPEYIIWLSKNISTIIIPPRILINCAKHTDARDQRYGLGDEYRDVDEMDGWCPSEWELLN